MRVARVRIERSGRSREIDGCWIELSPSRDTLGIWLSADAVAPVLRVPLEDARIEWAELDVPMP